MNIERLIRESAPAPSGRVVTMVFLSPQLPASLLSDQVTQALGREVGESVVLVQLVQPGNIIPNGSQRPGDFTLNGSFNLPAELPRTENGFNFLNLGVSGDLNPPGWIESVVTQLRRRFQYVLIEVVTDTVQSPELFEFLLHSDSGYFFARPVNEDVYHLDLLVRGLRPQLADSAVHIKPVLCLGEGEEVDGYDNLIGRVIRPVAVFIRGCPKPENANVHPSGSFHADVRRLAREIGSCLVGLALSSGAAKGLSHIGVIQVLEENGIDVDVVAGSSMGAYVGAAWCHGLDGQKLEALARELESKWALWSLIDPAFPPRQGFVRGEAVKNRLKRSIGNVRFAELVRPLRVMATNLETLERVIFSSGEVATAVHASTAVPGICVPVIIDGESYIDGGIVDPLPVDVLHEMGVSRVIAVNAIPTSDRIRYCLQAEHELAPLGKKRAREIIREVMPIDQHLNYFARGNILEILMRSIHGAQIRMAESSSRQADIVLRPQICDDRWLDFRDPGRFIQPGRQIAERHLDEIKALVARKTVDHETAFEFMAATA